MHELQVPLALAAGKGYNVRCAEFRNKRSFKYYYMGIDSVSEIVKQGANELNIDLPPEAGAAFKTYCDFLEEYGESVNLTAISGTENVARLHFLDSLALLKCTPFKNAKVIDIGSGGGFPGIPLKIAEPTIALTLLDSTRKKIDFINKLCSALPVEAVGIHMRAEAASHDESMREIYDIAVSRAVARLNILCELCLPLTRIGGTFIAMKSNDSDEEITEALSAIQVLGGEYRESLDYTIPNTDITHRAVLIQKVCATPERYPRRFAKIRKDPLYCSPD